jgi:hypothetical protein
MASAGPVSAGPVSVGRGTVGVWARSNGRPAATIKTAATVKAPPPITHHLRLAATGTAGGTLSSSTVRPTGGALAGSGE